MSKKSPAKTKPKVKKQNEFLFVQVFQMGILQVEKSFAIDTLFRKKVRIGGSRFCDLFLPFERHMYDLDIFKVGKGKAEILLDPRLDGYLNTSQRFGDLREFTSPRDALGVLTSIDDPLSVDLKSGARGRIRFFGFEVVFKIEKPRKEKIFTNLPKIDRPLFQLPATDSPYEKAMIPLGFACMAILFIPIVFWLLNYPTKIIRGLPGLPSSMISYLVAPENLRLLPLVYGNDFVPELAPQQSLLWVKELQNRWEEAEEGKIYHSSIPFLQLSNPPFEPLQSVNRFQEKISQGYLQLQDEKKKLAQTERYFNYIHPSPMFSSVTSVPAGISNYFMIEKRMQQLESTDQALVEYLKLDHIRVKEHYEKNYEAKKLGIITPPQTGQVIGPQADPIFFKELDNYRSAEYFAQIAMDSNFRKQQEKFLDEAVKSEKIDHFTYSEPVFIDEKGLLYPYSFEEEMEQLNQQQDYDVVIQNAIFSDEFILPPLPKPKPVIDLKMVEFVVFNKKEEIRSCYNSALRKNSKLSGNLKIGWQISEMGKAQNVRMVQGTAQDQYLFHCIERRVSVWKFPKAKNGAYAVVFPFQFVKKSK